MDTHRRPCTMLLLAAGLVPPLASSHAALAMVAAVAAAGTIHASAAENLTPNPTGESNSTGV